MKMIEFTEEQVKIIQNGMTKEQIETIREALITETDRLRKKLCVLHQFDDILTFALYNEEEKEDRIVDEGPAFYDKDLVTDDSEEV